MSRAPRHEPPSDLDDEGGGAPAGPTPLDWAMLLLHAALRRKLVFAAVLVAGLAGTVGYFAAKKPAYEVEAKVLIQRQAGPASVRSGYEESPTKSAWELVHRRENLVALIKAARVLPDEDPGKGARKQGFANRLQALVGREVVLGNEDPMDVLVTVLHKRLAVLVEDGTVSISLTWPDPQQAYDIVNGALQNFLEARYVLEVRAADEVIAVVQGRAAAVRAEFEAASDEARRRAARQPRSAGGRAGPRPPSEELARLQSLLEAKQRALADVEEFRRRRVADLQAQLDQTRNTLSEAHPKVIGLRKDIEAAGRDTPQLEALREEERAARKAYNERAARENPDGTVATAGAMPAIEVNPTIEEDPRVRQLRVQAEQMSLRVSAAQVELDAARAAFKYRYNVIWPPQRPTEPVSPNPKKIFPAGILASLLLAFAAAAAPDVLRGRICEPWQVERVLQVPVLGRIDPR